MVVLRQTIGDVLRDQRRSQGRTLREVSSTARVSLGYLSEVERGQKEASSELLASICSALELPLSRVLHEVTQRVAEAEGGAALVRGTPAPAAHPDGAFAAVATVGTDVDGDALAALVTLPEDVPTVVTLPEDVPADVADLVPDEVPAALVDALVEDMSDLRPADLRRAMEHHRRERLVSVA
ncbi:hypothetical protein NUM3379_13380 [Kineococcus sp. NUM-3379]